MAAETEATIDAMNAIIRDQGAEASTREDFTAYLRSHGVEGPDLDAMASVGPERFLVYRQLVHNRMRNATGDFIPRTVERLGKIRYRDDFVRFMEERAAKSYYLRDVPAEFVDWVGPSWGADPNVPDYLTDLARHELLDIDVRNDPRGGDEPTGRPLALDRPLRFDGACRLMAYGFAVHLLPLEPSDRSEPERGDTRLLVYRDDNNKVRYLQLIPFAAALLDELIGRKTAVEAGLRSACGKLGLDLDDDRLAEAATLLADLADRKVMLGAL